jgi:hypothetical protein
MIPRVVPAQLSFLAIYNPSLGQSDETIQDQIVFYYSKAARAGAKTYRDKIRPSQDLREQQNEQLRQVGLAQGMVGFARYVFESHTRPSLPSEADVRRGFSKGEAIESIETEKSRIVLHELEAGWWILAVRRIRACCIHLALTSLESVDLTQLPTEADSHSRSNEGNPDPALPAIEYTSREVSSPALLVRQLTRANSVFLLHHGATLGGLFEKLGRARFCNTLDRFWTKFATHWDVLLHGSPAVDIFGGIKLAAGGELGMGVGEEEWGSGEREVLEDFARRTDGLVDLMVSRFGVPSPLQPQTPKAAENSSSTHTPESEPWIGRGKEVGTGDGVVFSGIGSLSRCSLRDISRWVEDIYAFGEYAYGVRDSPTADRRRRRRKKPAPSEASHSEVDTKNSRPPSTAPSATHSRQPPCIPPPIVKAAESSLDKASNAVDATGNAQNNGAGSNKSASGDSETWVKYLMLGYGTSWGGRRSQSGERKASAHVDGEGERSAEAPMRYVEPEPDVDRVEEKLKRQVELENSGYFVIGLKGRMEEEEHWAEESDSEWNNRILIRTVHVELVNDAPLSTHTEEEKAGYGKDLMSTPQSGRARCRLRPVVYVVRTSLCLSCWKVC